MSLINRLRPAGSLEFSALPASQIIPIHVSAVPAANFRKVVEQLTPHFAAHPVAKDLCVRGIHLPAEVIQPLNLAETVVAQLLIQTGGQAPGILRPVAVELPAIRPENRPMGPEPFLPKQGGDGVGGGNEQLTSCISLVADAQGWAGDAAGSVSQCQMYQNQATAAVQAASAAADCSTQLQQAKVALYALNALDQFNAQAAGDVKGIDDDASQASILKCAQLRTAAIAEARTAASQSATQANQIATSATTTMLLASAQHLQALALAKCGNVGNGVVLDPNSIRVVTMWYGFEYQFNEKTTKDFENVCDFVVNYGLSAAALGIITAALLGSNPLAGAILTALVEFDAALTERAMKSADQGNGVTLHCSLAPIAGASIVFEGNIPAELATIEQLLTAGTLGIGVGGNPLMNVYWVTGN